MQLVSSVFRDPAVPLVLDYIFTVQRSVSQRELKAIFNLSYYKVTDILNQLIALKLVYRKRSKYVLYNSARELVSFLHNIGMWLYVRQATQTNTL